MPVPVDSEHGYGEAKRRSDTPPGLARPPARHPGAGPPNCRWLRAPCRSAKGRTPPPDISPLARYTNRKKSTPPYLWLDLSCPSLKSRIICMKTE